MHNMENFFKGKKVLVTGHTGFKGSWLSYILARWGANVVGVSLPSHTEPNLFTIIDIVGRVKNYFVDIRNFDGLESIFKNEQPEIVFHLAAQAIVRESYDDPLKTYTTNTLGTVNVLQCIKQTNSIRSAVIITTDKVYENTGKDVFYKENDRLGGFDPYSASKAAADIIAQSYIDSFFKKAGTGNSVNIGIARAGNVVGGGDWGKDRLIPDVIRSIYGGDGNVVIRNPDAIRPWQHVLEPLEGYLILAKSLYEGDTRASGAWNFGPSADQNRSVSDVVKKITDSLGGNYIVKKDEMKHEASCLMLDASKAKNILQWEPRLTWDECMAWTLDWYRAFYTGKPDIKELTDQQITKFF